MSKRRGGKDYHDQVNKKIKPSGPQKDIPIPSVQSFQRPELFKGTKPGNKDAVSGLVVRNKSADIPVPIFNSTLTQNNNPIKKEIINKAIINQRPQQKIIEQQDLTSKLHSLNIDEKYKQVLGDNLSELKKFARQKQKKEEAIKKLIQSGKIIVQKKDLPERIDNDLNSQVKLTEDGKLIDNSGNIIQTKEVTTALKINKSNKIKQKIEAMAKKQKFLKDSFKQDKGKFFDKNIAAGLGGQSLKREKQKLLALNFIEKGTFVNQSLDIVQTAQIVDEDKSALSLPNQSELNQQPDQKELEQQNGQNEVKEQKEDDLKDTKRNLSSYQQILLKYNERIVGGFKRVSVRMKHYDPIPNIEWWDSILLPSTQGNYIPLSLLSQERQEQNELEQNQQYQIIQNNFSNRSINDKIKQPATAHSQEEIKRNLEILQDYQFEEKDLKLDKITHLIEHPKPFAISEIIQNREKSALPSYLTKKEKKKRLRRMRMEAEKDKQDKIRLGLMKPSPPKIKLSNMMRILGTEAILDPSKAEKEVKKQMQERFEKHMAQNESKKLSKEQRGEKIKKKWNKDASQEIRTAVFRIDDLNDPTLKFKVNVNAQQVGLQGVCLIAIKSGQSELVPSIVIVEGGPKGIKFYKKLLMRRIRWNQPNNFEVKIAFNYIYKNNIETDKSKNGCTLIWEGIVKQHAFNKWKLIEMKSEADGRRILAEKGCEHYWDLVMNSEKQ